MREVKGTIRMNGTPQHIVEVEMKGEYAACADLMARTEQLCQDFGWWVKWEKDMET